DLATLGTRKFGRRLAHVEASLNDVSVGASVLVSWHFAGTYGRGSQLQNYLCSKTRSRARLSRRPMGSPFGTERVGDLADARSSAHAVDDERHQRRALCPLPV